MITSLFNYQMNKIKKIFYLFFGLLFLFVLTACGETNSINVVDAEINDNNELVFELSDGTFINVGVVVGEKGQPGNDGSSGVGIKSININDEDELIITLTDGTNRNLGKIKGSDGQNGTNGKDGEDGKDGIGIKNIIINENGELVITYTNDTSKNLGKVRGEDGEDGVDGEDGIDGKNGKDGKDGKDGENGKDGKDGENGLSSYQLYLKYFPGYNGTEKEWIVEHAKGELVLNLILDLHDGKIPNNVEVPKNVMKGEFYSPPIPEREGYIFVGWFHDNKFEVPFNSEEAFLKDTILHACWLQEGKWQYTGSVGAHTIEDETYIFQEFELLINEEKISLSQDNIKTIKCNGKELIPNTDETLWFNVLNERGDYLFEIIDKDYVLYKATLKWDEPIATKAEKIGSPIYNEERNEIYQLYVVDIDVDEDSKVYQIKPDGSISELGVLDDEDNILNLWFRLSTPSNLQQEGLHVFLIEKEGYWYKVSIPYGIIEGTWQATGNIGNHEIDGVNYLFEEFELLVDGKRINLSEDNILSIKCNGEQLIPNTDSTLWMNVLSREGKYEFDIIDKNYVSYNAILNWEALTEVTAIKEGNPIYNEERDEIYQLYVVDIDIDENSKVYQIKPDGSISELIFLDDDDNVLNIWFRLGTYANMQQEGTHTFLILKDGTWNKVNIEYEIIKGTWQATGNVGNHEIDGVNYLFEEFELLVDDKKISLNKDDITSIYCNGKELIANDDYTLWFNVLNESKDYKFIIYDKDLVCYEAILNWEAPTEVTAIKEGNPIYNEERDEIYQLYVVDIDVDENSKVYQIKPDGSISELIFLDDDDNVLNIWFRLGTYANMQQEGTHTFLISDNGFWKKVEIIFEYKLLVKYGFNLSNEFVVLTNEYENDLMRLSEQFIKDWNTYFGSSLTTFDATSFFNSAKIGATSITNLAGSNIYRFFNDEVYGEKWGWLLDFIKEIDKIAQTIHTTRQIIAIQGDGTNDTYKLYNASHLSYSIANFFNRAHDVGGYTAINFTSESKYEMLEQFNTIPYDLSKYQLCYFGDNIILPKALNLDNYQFIKYTDGINDYDEGDTIIADKEIILKMIYEPIEYTIKFYENGNELTELERIYTCEEEFDLPKYEKEGYVFEGWYCNPEFTGESITSISKGTTGDKVLYAKIIESPYVDVEVTYNLNGGILNSSDLIKYRNSTFIEATRYSTSGDPLGAKITVGTDRGGKWWYVIALKPSSINGVYEVIGKGPGYTNSEATLYISYHDNCTSLFKTTIKNVYNNLENGSFVVIEWLPSEITSDTLIDIYFIEESEAKADVTITMNMPEPMLTPARAGYTFAGWCRESDCSDTPITAFPGFEDEDNVTEVTYYAKWNKN